MVEVLENFIIFCVGVTIFEISAYFLNLIFTKNARNFKMRRQIFPLLRQIASELLGFAGKCKFHGNRHHATRYTKRW